MSSTYKRLNTKVIHAGEPEPRIGGAVIMPIFQTAMYETAGESDYHAVRYIRLNNSPNHLALHEKLAALENAEAALVAASGMAAISTTLFALLSAGDHLLVQDCLYVPYYIGYLEPGTAFGLTYDFIDDDDPASWKRKLRPNTKAIYVETMSNPLLQVGDLQAIAYFARENDLVSIVDNTFASPVNFRPVEWGFDLSLHSATKYLNGHSDIVAGVVIGRADLVTRVTHKLNHLGGSLDPHAAFLLHRGLKTLALRVRYQNDSALKIAQFLESHPAVARVNYPGLESHPRHQRARELFEGCGGVLSFEPKGAVAAAEQFLKKTQLATAAPSLGGVETLVTRPATTSHAGLSLEDRQRLGISDSLIRVSIGIEATEDLMEDFDQAL